MSTASKIGLSANSIGKDPYPDKPDKLASRVALQEPLRSSSLSTLIACNSAYEQRNDENDSR